MEPPVQFIHEDDVAQAFLLCIAGKGSPGAYNIGADDIFTGSDVARGPAGSGARSSRIAEARYAARICQPPVKGGI